MTVLFDWALAEGIPFAAIRRLQQRLGTFEPAPPGQPGRSEASVQAAAQVRASQLGGVLWRNNVGGAYLEDGTFLRYGIANDTAAMNKRIKSPDLIGVRPKVVEQHHVGATWGVFWAVEVKRGDWTYSGDDHERAQLKFLELALSMGGDASFCNDEGQLS